MISGINPFNPFITYAAKPTEANSSAEADASSTETEPTEGMSPEAVKRELERIRTQSEAAGKAADTLGKAITIASRIIAGDVVPDKDDKFLLENYPEMHMKAWLLRRAKEEPEEYKSLLDDDDEIRVEIPWADSYSGCELSPLPEMCEVAELDVLA